MDDRVIPTPHVMYPRNSSEKEDIVQKKQEIDGLINKKVMPRVSREIWIKEEDHCHDLLCWNDGNTSSASNPSQNIEGAAYVALQNISLTRSEETLSRKSY